MKTLIGKENYLFLQNDSNKELEVHNDNLCLIRDDFYLRFEKYKSKYMIAVFPNKSFVCKNFLPDQFNLQYRPAFNKYENYFKDRIVDLYPHLAGKDTFYKTDTHMNLNGAYISYGVVLDKINELFNLSYERIPVTLNKQTCILSELNIGLGDLTWEMNLGEQHLEDRTDTYYYSDDIEMIFTKYIINPDNKRLRILDYELKDKTKQLSGLVTNWDIFSKYILYSSNKNVKIRKKILVFYDSFLLSSLSLWMNTFYEAYFIKSNFNADLIKKIKPDCVIEFRVERFLN